MREGAAFFHFGAFDRGGVFYTPVGCHRMSKPDRAGFSGGAVADREDEVHFRCARLSELVPALRTEAGRWISKRLELVKGMRVDLAFRMAAGRESLEAALAFHIQDGLRQDRTGGIARAL